MHKKMFNVQLIASVESVLTASEPDRRSTFGPSTKPGSPSSQLFDSSSCLQGPDKDGQLHAPPANNVNKDPAAPG